MTDMERLITWLLKDYEDSSRDIPGEKDAQERLLRALMNLWAAKDMPEDFWRLQDAVLGQQRERKGVVDAASLPTCPGEPRIVLWQGDITRLNAQAVVNAANSGMTGCYHPNHNCIDNCIHSAAGLQLRLACQRLMDVQGHEEPTGLAKLTPGFNLPSAYVLHTVGPIVNGSLTHEHRRLLASSYRACLDLTVEHQIQCVAFPCISTGVFGFPQEPAAEIAINTVRTFLAENTEIKRVIFNVYQNSDLYIYQRLLAID